LPGQAQRQGGANWRLLLTLGIALAVGVRVWSLWSQLPDTMASHYGLSGRADSYMSKEGFFLVMRANIHRTNLDNRTFIIVMVGYMGFAGYVFFRRKHLLRLPEGSGS
jgi:uncharacterized membrane protein